MSIERKRCSTAAFAAAAALAAALATEAAHAAHVSVLAPERGARVTLGDPLVIVGSAGAASGVSRVDVAVRDLATGRWLDDEGAPAGRRFQRATLHDGGATTADWSHAFTPPGTGRYRIVARAYDGTGAAIRPRHTSVLRVVAPSAPPPVAGGYGEFVAFCPASHRLRDDPIVFPGEPGRSHLHSFFGSTATDAFTTLATLLGTGTTCDPPGDRSAYWVPALLENGVPVEPEQATFYYVTDAGDPADVRPFPLGLRILAGNPARTGPDDGPSRYTWSCRGAAASSTGDFATCPAGHELELLLNFPDCWNGSDLDSPDHKAHMAYGAGGTCPASHPVAVPRLQFKLRYPTSGGPGIRIAGGSGEHAHHAGRGWTAHGDFLNGWLPGELAARVERCSRPSVKCGPDGTP